MRRSTLETIAILAWLLLLPLAATWLASQGKTSATLLLGVLIVATIAWVMRWARRPTRLARLIPGAFDHTHAHMANAQSDRVFVKTHVMDLIITQRVLVFERAVLEGLESDDDNA